MKELVRMIFGDEAAEDKDVVDFYERVNYAAVENNVAENLTLWIDRQIKRNEYLRSQTDDLNLKIAKGGKLTALKQVKNHLSNYKL